MKIVNIELNIIRGDITEIQTDSIVIPSHTGLGMDEGIAAVIKQKGGAEIESEAKQKSPLEIGEAIATKAGQLQAKYIIHAVIVEKDHCAEEEHIRKACERALECALPLDVESIALPALGCGPAGFPTVGAAKIMAQEILKFSRKRSQIKNVIICLKDQKTFEIFEKNIYGYLEHIKNDLSQGPYVTVDIIIELDEGIILIERSNPPFGWALPGGFLDYGESLEVAAAREAKEETDMDLENLRQMHTYSEPGRDPRFHTVSTVFIAKGKGTPQFGDDAKGLKVVKYEDLLKLDYAFDHNRIVRDYINLKTKE